MNLQMFRISILGGAGEILGLIVLMLRNKSAHLKTVSKNFDCSRNLRNQRADYLWITHCF